MAATPEVGQTVLLQTSDVARILNIHRRTVLRLAKSGELTYVQVSKYIRRFRPEDIEDFLNQRRSTPSSE